MHRDLHKPMCILLLGQRANFCILPLVPLILSDSDFLEFAFQFQIYIL